MSTINDLKYVLESVLGCECKRGSDHVSYLLKINGRVIARTKYSHSWRGNHQIDENMLSIQARQMGCSNKTWKRLLQGLIPKEEYFNELVARGIMTQEEYDSLFGNSAPEQQK